MTQKVTVHDVHSGVLLSDLSTLKTAIFLLLSAKTPTLTEAESNIRFVISFYEKETVSKRKVRKRLRKNLLEQLALTNTAWEKQERGQIPATKEYISTSIVEMQGQRYILLEVNEEREEKDAIESALSSMLDVPRGYQGFQIGVRLDDREHQLKQLHDRLGERDDITNHDIKDDFIGVLNRAMAFREPVELIQLENDTVILHLCPCAPYLIIRNENPEHVTTIAPDKINELKQIRDEMVSLVS